MKSFRIVVLSVLVVALLIGAMGRANTAVAQQEDRKDWPANFLVGIFAGEDATKALTGAEPIRVYLENKLKMRVVMYTGGSYTAVIQAMKAGRVDAFEVGPFAYILAVQEANAEALAVNA